MARVSNGVEIAENFSRLSMANERYRQTTERQTDMRQHTVDVDE